MKLSAKYPWHLVALLWVVALLNYMDRQMIATMRPAMQVDFPSLAQAANFGRLMAVFLWVYGCMSPFAGWVADRLNRKRLIIGSLMIWSTVTLSMGLASSLDTLYALRAIMGVSEALYFPAALSLIADHHSERTRSRAMGIHLSGIYLGQALGGFGSTVSMLTSWKMAFISFGGVGMLYALFLLFTLHDPSREQLNWRSAKVGLSSPFKGLRDLFHSFPFWIMVVYFAIPSLPGWAVKNWAPTLISSSLNIDMSLAGPLTTVSISLSSLGGVLFGGWLSDKWFSVHPKGRMYTSAIGLALTIPSLILLGFIGTLPAVLVGAVLFGLGFGMFDCNNMPILCQFIREEHRATGYGLLNTAGFTAGAFITEFLGRSTDAGNLGTDFAWLAVAVLFIIIIQLIFFKSPAQKNLQ